MADLSDAESVDGTQRGLKRGRPSTTGEYVGLVVAKAKKLALDRAELELQAERDVAEAARKQRNLLSANRAARCVCMGKWSYGGRLNLQ